MILFSLLSDGLMKISFQYKIDTLVYQFQYARYVPNVCKCKDLKKHLRGLKIKWKINRYSYFLLSEGETVTPGAPER